MGVWIRWTGMVEWNGEMEWNGLTGTATPTKLIWLSSLQALDGDPIKYGLDCRLHAGHFFHRSLDQGYW